MGVGGEALFIRKGALVMTLTERRPYSLSLQTKDVRALSLFLD